MSTPASSTNESVSADPRPPSLLERLAATPLSLLERLSTPPAESPVFDMDEDTGIPSSDHLALLRSSVGALFRPSHIPADDPEKLHCAVKVHGGDEPRFHDDTEPGALRRPAAVVNRAGSGFSIDLLNRVIAPLPELMSAEIPLELGQLVWRTTRSVSSWGRRVLDRSGPYIIIDNYYGYYILMTKQGEILHFPVPARDLCPCVTTWHVVDLPRTITNHSDVQDIIASFYKD